ncbi:lipopolysaccharide transport periplasmic protein LptA [Gallaecimonas kandeliae]|uniref:lipopolysaccharide transport periplasmic protein LptA n=1 Tax=Gallaecimonas kandeliae TaxID=3029055 RepID=UPI0026496ADE|nr:lipopolysaccharide transport periplasmic protein LptA [Gallaecimonas kandeliae]WKE66050.1 lipopolysaccharide transport periplasmic protein LptA [Gallaecimonas kandeliae]
MNSLKIISSAFLALALPLLAVAADGDFNKKIEVSAQKNYADGIKKRVIYEDKVQINQGSLKIQASRVEIDASGNERIFIATGKPVRFQQKLNDGTWVKAEAFEIRYYDTKRLVVMKGNAQIEQQGSLAKGDTIEYDLNAQRLVAEAKDDNSRVVTIFEPGKFQQPKEPKVQEPKAKEDQEPQPNPEQQPQPLPQTQSQAAATFDQQGQAQPAAQQQGQELPAPQPAKPEPKKEDHKPQPQEPEHQAAATQPTTEAPQPASSAAQGGQH